ncbi:MAG: hypothetical protein ABUK01_11335 [Leptospirales bacterium]
MNSDHNELVNILTQAEPLGPIAHERIIKSAVEKLIYDDIPLFSDAYSKPHMLFLGRKGSGKSALLGAIRRNSRKKGRQTVMSKDDEPTKGRNYVIAVYSWEHFHQMVRNVKRLTIADGEIDELIPVEYFVKLWYETLWDEIIQYFYNFHAFEDCRKVLQPVEQYINVDGIFEGSSEKRANDLFEKARNAVLEFLEIQNSKLYFLFDSMENYPVRNTTFVTIIAGLFQGLSKINDDSMRIIASFCLPEEVESFITNNSANLMKDLSSSSRIRWKPVDLIRIVAHRLRVSASYYDKALYHQIKLLDFSKRDDLHNVFQLVLPEVLKNSQGTSEDPIAYIIRHTQLLPRHILAIFNSALSYHYKMTNTFTDVTEDAIKQGVQNTQKLIAQQILDPYEKFYPKLLLQCNKILPDLDPINSYNDLKRIKRRFNRVIEDDITSVWETLFEMGVIGRSMNNISTNHDSEIKKQRYCYGQFHYNIEGSFGLATDGEFCFHPVFSRYFGMSRRNGDKRVVYPANIDLGKIYED